MYCHLAWLPFQQHLVSSNYIWSMNGAFFFLEAYYIIFILHYPILYFFYLYYTILCFIIYILYSRISISRISDNVFHVFFFIPHVFRLVCRASISPYGLCLIKSRNVYVPRPNGKTVRAALFNVYLFGCDNRCEPFVWPTR